MNALLAAEAGKTTSPDDYSVRAQRLPQRHRPHFCLVIPGYTRGMKTAISVPDKTFAEASRRAQELGVSRSEFFSRAADRYLDELDAASVTDQINQAVDENGQPDDSASAAVLRGQCVLSDSSDDW